MLRRPFALPNDVQIKHKCKWERFAFDKLGCVLCAAKHECAAGKCSQTYECEDGTICQLSGVVINKYNFQMHEWDNNYPSYAMRRNLNLRNKTDRNTDGIIYNTVQEILCQCDDSVMTHGENSNLLKQLSQQICTTVAFFSTEMCMKIKSLDYRNLAIGMLYLMKHGISMHGVNILPKVPILMEILPAESQLHRRFNFKCKNITDVENKIKLFLRDISIVQLEKICWNTNSLKDSTWHPVTIDAKHLNYDQTSNQL